MKLKSFALLAGVALLGLAGFAGVHAQGGGIAPPKVTLVSESQVIPFELFRGNRVVVSATLNGHETEVILDTGASVTTVDRAYARSIGLPQGMKIAGHGAGGRVDAELVSGASLGIGGMRLEDMSVGVLDLSLVARAIGRPVNVVVGRDFFNSAVVSIDWAGSRLRLTPRDAFKPGTGSIALELKRTGPFNTIPVSIAGSDPVEALLDLGNGAALTVPKSYWGERKELATLPYGEGQSGGVGGVHSSRNTIVPRVGLAGTSFANVPVTLVEGGNDHEATKMTNVGIGLLKQFRVDLDLGRDRIYLTPRADAPGFDRDRAGVRMELLGDRLKVAFVSPRGPAAAAGLKAGDEVVAVDGHKVTPDSYGARDWTRGAVGTPVVLQRADGTSARIILKDYY